MRIFKLNKDYNVVCNWINTRYGFKHEATLLKGGYDEVSTAKMCYYNRTWEKFEYESVLHKIIDEYEGFTDAQKNRFKGKINKEYGY